MPFIMFICSILTKLFAELVIQKMSEEDSLSIVSFSDSAEINLPMTRMTKQNKVY